MSWHVDEDVLRRYQTGAVDPVTAASVEAHVTECGDCRATLQVDDGWVERSWAGIADRVEPGRRGLIERLLAGIGVRPDLARVTSLSPAFRLSFILAVVLVMGFAVAASNTNPDGWTFRLFFVVAPLVPVAGIAFAYGQLVDPAHELTLSSPLDSFKLLMLRAVTVLGVSMLLGWVTWVFVEAPLSFGPSAWLAPALALTVVTLALASRFETWVAGAMVAGGWIVATVFALTRELEIFDATAQTVYLAAALAAALVVVLRRHSYDREGGHR